jgi:hypothetical protein
MSQVENNSVSWQDNLESGWWTRDGGGHRIYSPKGFIKEKIALYALNLLSYPGVAHEHRDHLQNVFDPLTNRRKEYFRVILWPRVKDLVHQEIYAYLKCAAEKHEMKEHPFWFLLKLGLQGRNWKSGCVVCSTTRRCGHTEIGVFTPCGHSMCAKPCLEQFLHSQGVQCQLQEWKTDDGTILISHGKLNINLEFPVEKQFPCPSCRTLVESCFRAESVCCPKGLVNDLYHHLSQLESLKELFQ